jgi:hypothetical protein
MLPPATGENVYPIMSTGRSRLQGELEDRASTERAGRGPPRVV